MTRSAVAGGEAGQPGTPRPCAAVPTAGAGHPVTVDRVACRATARSAAGAWSGGMRRTLSTVDEI